VVTGSALGQAGVALIPGRAPSVRAGCCYYDTNPAQRAHPGRRPPGRRPRACRGWPGMPWL